MNTQVAKPVFNIGRVINRAFNVIIENWKPFLLWSFVLLGLPDFAIELFSSYSGVFADYLVQSGPPEKSLILFIIGVFIGVVLAVIIIVVLQILLLCAIIHASILFFSGQPVDLRVSFAVARKYFWPIIGASILCMIGIMFGFLFLILPGLFLLLMWYIVTPCILMEDLSVTAGLARSRELTSGYKRWILLILLIFIGIALLVSGVQIGTSFALIGMEGLTNPETVSPIIYVISALFSAITATFINLFSYALNASIYYELRDIREGFASPDSGSVFN